MSTGAKKKRGSSRVAPLDLPPSRLARSLMALQRPDVMLRLMMCFATAVAIWGISSAWAPAFTFRENYVPVRDVMARVKFARVDDVKTKELRENAFKQAPYVYTQDPRDLDLRRADLNLLLDEVAASDKLADLKPDTWKQFQLPATGSATSGSTTSGTTPAPAATPAELEKQADDYKQFHSTLIALGDAEKRKAALDGIFGPLKTRGILTAIPDLHGDRNREKILIYPAGRTKEYSLVPLDVPLTSVLLGDGSAVKTLIREQLGNSTLSDRVTAWLLPKLKSTLSLDVVDSLARQEAARDAVEVQEAKYASGTLLAPAGVPITPEALNLLRLEYDAYITQLPMPRRLERSLAVFCMIFALYVLCGYYMFYRERRLLSDLLVFCTMLASAIGVIALVHWTTADPWRAELIPLLLFSMTFGIAYHRDVALILSTSMAIIVAMTGGEGLGEFIVLMGTVATAVLQLDTIRTRGKLIRVGLVSAIVAFLLSLGMSLFDDQPLGETILRHAGRNALWTFLTGFLMTGLLPYIEKLFGVLTDISLLELGDPSHPLMQELVRRAPGTYNHSINVASIAEAAAEQIGARGLLLRVGAYFHDIGKMLKPNYFVENQGMQASRHENLLPAMSTLIIIAHVKDGADLARQHHLPQPIIDFIEQHHGTTLVEYFYRQASKKSEENPEVGEVQESSYRYPGPKPQTVETAILMLADSVESASRSLVEPTPSRIENLVEQIGMNKLLDGQFDECGLTLQQLRVVEDSLIKSLIAVYHGRVKYASTASA
ncbi:MAG: HDIG domain-containing protein [Planctomycetia bacterium]|nr:HDIG domain-containing protein [Planctomycetia bacterium]